MPSLPITKFWPLPSPALGRSEAPFKAADPLRRSEALSGPYGALLNTFEAPLEERKIAFYLI